MAANEASEPNGSDMRTSAEADTDDLARGAGVNYLGYVARIAPRVLFLVLAGRLYGEAQFGIYTFGITVVETAAALALFGMKRSLFKFMSEEVNEGGTVHRAVAHGVALSLMVGTVLTVAAGAGSGILARSFDLPDATLDLMVLTMAIPMIVISDILLVAIRFTRQMRFEVYARSLAEPITLTAGVVVLWWAGVRDAALSIAYTASLTVAAATTVFFFVRVFDVRKCLRASLSRDELRRLATFSGPTAAYEFFLMTFDKVDVFLVSYFLPAPVIGVYGMARQFSTVTKKIRGGFDRILPPILSESIEAGNLKRAEGQLATVARWILTVQGLLVLFFVFFGEDLLGLMGSGFTGGALVLVFLMVGDAVHGSLGISELPFVFLRPATNVVFGAVLLAVGAGLNVWLIQLWGAEGAALAVLITVAVVNGARVVASRMAFDLEMVNWTLLKPVAAAVPAGAALLGLQALLPDSPLLLLVAGVPALIATYGLALRLLGLEPEDRAQVQRLLDRVRG